MYSYDDLFLFAKVVEVRSFVHTSKLLNTTHTTVSRRIKALEEQLGVTLIKFDTRNFEVTEIGQQVYDLIKNEAYSLDERINEIVKHQKEPTGLIKVQLPVVMFKNLITPEVPKFLRKYKKIRLAICYQNGEIDLVKDGFDLAIINHIPKQQSVKIKNVFNSSLKLYCTRAYADKYGVPKSIEELSNHLITGFMMADKTIPNNCVLTNIKTQQETIVSMPNRIVLNNADHVTQLLLSNEVICGIYNAGNTFSECKDTEIVPVLPDYAMLNMNFYMIRHPQTNDHKVQLFSDFLENCLKKASK